MSDSVGAAGSGAAFFAPASRASIDAASRRARWAEIGAVPPERDPLPPDFHEIGLRAGGLDRDSEAGQVAVAERGLPAGGKRIDHPRRDRPRPPHAARPMSAPMLPPTLAAESFSASRAAWA